MCVLQLQDLCIAGGLLVYVLFVHLPYCSQTGLRAAAWQVPIKHRRQMLARGGLDFGHLVNLSCKYAETHLKGSLLDRKQIGSLR